MENNKHWCSERVCYCECDCPGYYETDFCKKFNERHPVVAGCLLSPYEKEVVCEMIKWFANLPKFNGDSKIDWLINDKTTFDDIVKAVTGDSSQD